MIEITDSIALDENEVQLEFTRSSGPGGQKVNKVATAVRLRFDVVNSPSLPDNMRPRLRQLAGNRITAEGELIIEAQQYRTQEQNRQDAIDRLVELLRKAAKKPKRRRKTRRTRASQERRLKKKRRRSEIKRLRRSVPPRED